MADGERWCGDCGRELLISTDIRAGCCAPCRRSYSPAVFEDTRTAADYDDDQGDEQPVTLAEIAATWDWWLERGDG